MSPFDLYTLFVLLPSSTIITLDGLAASGKSSVAQELAQRLNISFVSSGLLYRLVALAALETKTDPNSETALLAVLKTHDLRFEAQVSGNSVYLDNTDVTMACHSSRIDALVSIVAQHLPIRGWVNAQIRLLEPPFIAEGRDMGTNVFPNASVKIFLTASSLVRATRRVAERSKSLGEIEASIKARDARDAINSNPAKDAILLDSSDLNFEQTVQLALEMIGSKLDAV